MNTNETTITKTVYSPCYPESEAVLKEMLENAPNWLSMYHNSYTKKQDNYHLTFLRAYQKWSAPIVECDWEQYNFAYPTNGSSEAIREQIAFLLGAGVMTIYVFEGEYEGYEAIAHSLNMRVVKVSRTNFEFNKFSDEDCALFLSQPSSIDGNVWADYERFMAYMDENHSNVRIYVDLVYVGCVAKSFTVNLNFKNIDGIFFSLSKAMGVYYHRIGGCFLRHSNPLLYGNMWFKNIQSMLYGESLMSKIGVYEIPRKYKDLQKEAISQLSGRMKITASDVMILGTAKLEDVSKEDFSFLTRNYETEQVRVCFSPIVEKMARGV